MRSTDKSTEAFSKPQPQVNHVLSSWKVTLSQGRYRWRNDQVVKERAKLTEGKVMNCQQWSCELFGDTKHRVGIFKFIFTPILRFQMQSFILVLNRLDVGIREEENARDDGNNSPI